MTLKSATTTDDRMPVPTPGDILKHDFLDPMGLSQNALARAIDVPPGRINEIVLGKRTVSAETDLRLCRYLGLSEGYFLRLQNTHDRLIAKRRLGPALDLIKPYGAAA